MMENSYKPMQSIMKQIVEAQNFDVQNDQKAAYLKYLHSIQLIAEHLISQAQTDFVCNASTKKVLSLATMCIQRSEDIINKGMEARSDGGSQATSVAHDIPRPLTSPHSLPPDPADFLSLPNIPGSSSLPAPPSSHAVGRQASQAHNVPGIGYMSLQVSATTAHIPAVKYNKISFDVRSPQEQSPLEVAERQNRQIMAAYQARVQGLGNRRGHKTTDLSLGLQRRLAENLALAKAREETLAKKRAERRKRLEELASSRFAATDGMSADELERRQIYTRILEFEQDNKWLVAWRDKLKEKPEDCVLIQQLVAQIVKTATHPLTRLLYGFQHQIYDKIQPLLIQWQEAVQRSNQGQGHAESEACQVSRSSSREPMDPISVSSQASSGKFSPSAYDMSNFDDLFEYKPDSPVFNDSGSKSEQNIDRGETVHEIRGSISQPDTCSENRTLSSSSLQDDGLASDISSQNVPDSEFGNKTVMSEPTTEKLYSNELHTESEDVIRNEELTAPSAAQSSDPGTLNLTDALRPADISQTSAPQTPSSPALSLLELQREALMRHLAGVVRDVQDRLEKLVTMFVVAYVELDSATGRDSCYSGLEPAFYAAVWGHVLALYRAVHYKEEQSLTSSMARYKSCSPESLRVPRCFCLLPEDTLLMPEGYEPYRAAIRELQSISEMVSPLNKLECIVQISRLVCKCIEDFHQNNSSEVPNIGADDLLPILSFVVVKSDLPQILAECHALEELVHEGYLMGEEGYCLTSLMTAVRYVATL